MTFGTFTEATAALKAAADTVSDVGIAKIDELLDMTNATFSKIEALGLSSVTFASARASRRAFMSPCAARSMPLTPTAFRKSSMRIRTTGFS
jgi:hypothetical protein